MNDDEPQRFTVAVDFDGVIHAYTTPWSNAETIPDGPVPGAIAWMNTVIEDYDLVVFTTRADTAAGAVAVKDWLAAHGGPDVVVTNRKPPAVIYIDDRGWRFNGRFPSAKAIRHTHPWKVGTPQRETAKEQIAKRGRRLAEVEQKQAKLKVEIRELRRMLLAEMLSGRGFTEPDILAWLEEHDKEPFKTKLEAAFNEAVRV